MRPETALILSGIDATTLAKFPRELDPCVNEVLRDPDVLNAIFADAELISRTDFTNILSDAAVREYPEIAASTLDVRSLPVVSIAAKIAPASVVTADDIRRADVDVREEVARVIQTVTIPETMRITNPTPVPGVVTPKPETGLPLLPVVIPSSVPKVPAIAPGGTNTIELQELIPGIKLPAIPLLLPGLEKLPLLPGWTIRDREGKVLNQGADLPTLPQGIMGIPIPQELPRERVPTSDVLRMVGLETAGGALGGTEPMPEEFYPEEAILENHKTPSRVGTSKNPGEDDSEEFEL